MTFAIQLENLHATSLYDEPRLYLSFLLYHRFFNYVSGVAVCLSMCVKSR